MKQYYYLRHLMVFLSFFYCFSATVFAQGTAPSPQDLPYTQNFLTSTLPHTSTSYPAGFQGWTASVTPGSAFNTSGTLVADRSLTASGNATTTSGNVHNYDGKIGFLNASSLDLTIGFAFKTLGKYGISVEYNAMTIRNPYGTTTGSTVNTRINEMVLQYRVGTTTDFITVSNTEYQNNTTTQTGSGVTTPQNPQLLKVKLPDLCNNQPVVQIRWISRQVSGGGSRPSFAIDDINIQFDDTAPVYESGFPKISAILSTGFDFVTKINEPGKTFYVVLPTGSAAPSIAQIKAGTDATDTAALRAGLIDITDAAAEYTQSVTGLSSGTSYDLYAISEDRYAKLQDDSTLLSTTTSSVAVPSITTAVTNLNFGLFEQNTTSTPFNYELQAQNLSNEVTLSITGNFLISKTETGTYQNNLSYTVTEFDNSASPKVFVKFAPTATGTVTGTITHQTTGGANKTVTLTGEGINPYFQDFNDPNVFTNSGWTEFSVTGDKIKWVIQNTRFNSTPAAVQINGFNENGASKDWLISPALRLNTFDKFPLLSFYSRKFFAGTSLKLMVSTNYDGKSNPETATWTPLNGDFPTTTGTFKQSQFINLEAYKSNATYVAWVYETAFNGIGESAEWTIDDVEITNEAAFVAALPSLNFGEVTQNSVSSSQSFTFMAGGYGAITIAAPLNYQLSLDNTIFQNNVALTAEQALNGTTIHARFAPTSKELNSTGVFQLNGTGLNTQLGMLTASSIPKTETFDIVTYNLEFFGSNVIDSGGDEFGPTNDALQIDNVAQVMNTLNADVYAVQEVSDDAALETLIQKININGKTFDKVISPSWSRSFDAPNPQFPPQKLVVIYNTQTTTVKNTRVMFKKLYDDVRAGTTTLPNYPSSGSSFYSSGRLPYMVEIETNINGVKKDLTIINLHARANSSDDKVGRYNMRKYDVELLKDSLDAQYPDANLIILGDYNDDVDTSVVDSNPSSYQKIVEDNVRYNPLTLEISKAGAFSFLSSGGFLDHITISNELTDEYVTNTTVVYDPRNDVPNYVNTTSDHGPVVARFELKADTTLSTNDPFTKNGISVVAYPNPTSESFNIVINSENPKDLDLNIYDILGRTIGTPIKIKSATGDNNTNINISKLPQGMYIYTLSNGNKVVYKNKIVKR